MLERIDFISTLITDRAAGLKRARWGLRSGWPLVAALVVSGCMVPATRYEEAVSASKVERSAHQMTMKRLYSLEKRLDQALSAIQKRENEIESSRENLQRAALEHDVLSKERDNAASLVEQLRGELGRVGDHLRFFADEKTRLTNKLSQTETELQRLRRIEQRAERDIRLARDVTLALYGSIQPPGLKFEAIGGEPVVRLQSEKLFVDDQGTVNPELATVLEALAKAVRVSGYRLTLTEVSDSRVLESTKEGAQASEAKVARLNRVAESLQSGGLPRERIVVDLQPTDRSQLDASSRSERASDHHSKSGVQWVEIRIN